LAYGIPETLEQIIGQSAVTARFRAMLVHNRVAHAIILAGPDGSGKRTLASIFARALFCSSIEKPCNHCSQCRKAIAGNHADLHVIIPVEDGREKGKAETTLQPGTPRLKMKSLGVEEARSIQRLIDVRPYEGGRTVVIIDSAHELTAAAQNALLKILEEPPDHVVFLLLADSLSSLLPTVLSRCSVFSMARLTASEMMAVLAGRGLADDPRAADAASLADGWPGKALALLQDEPYWVLRGKAETILRQLVTHRSLAEAMRFLQDNRSKWPDILDLWERAIRDEMVRRAGANAGLLSGNEAFDMFLSTESEKLEQLLLSAMETRRSLDGNGIYTIAMDRLLIELSGGIA
jgi:DNA polymerase-3 subunit delta'